VVKVNPKNFVNSSGDRIASLVGIDFAKESLSTYFTMNGGHIMSLLTRWDPTQDLQEFEKRLSSWMGRPSLAKDRDKESMRVMDWAPLVDITEDDKEYLIKADLPEIKKEDVKISVVDGVLAISGERKYEKEEKGKKYHRVERSYGSFERSFSVPADAEEEKVSAQFKDGVLMVHLPKGENAKPKRLQIKVS
jgi:HSP20 family protein